jgi:hypothetical protein
MVRFFVYFLFGFATAYAGWESLPPSAAREVLDVLERAQELIAVLAMAGGLSVASIAFAVRKGLVAW